MDCQKDCTVRFPTDSVTPCDGDKCGAISGEPWPRKDPTCNLCSLCIVDAEARDANKTMKGWSTKKKRAYWKAKNDA